ncbi:MAG: D-alanine--D-alanine ligase family protein [Solirubrobacteraceae bacterium]
MSARRRVAVLGGGRSSEHEVSLASAAAVAAGLRDCAYEVREIEIGRDGVWRARGAELSLAPGRGIEGADVVFPALHGPYGEDGTVQGLLECLDVPYVGAGVLASALCMDKVLFKDVMAHAGLPQVQYRAVTLAGYRVAPERELERLAALGVPVFVKPARLGSSVGIARVSREGELPDALRAAFAHDSRVIVEAAAPGLEVECSVIGSDEPLASEPGEIVLAGGDGGWYDYAAKYTPGAMRLIVPARIDARARDHVRELAVRTFTLAGCSGLARVDFFVDGNEVLVNELNTIPGFTQTSVFGALFEASGVPYAELLRRLVELAIERHERERALRH